VRSVFFLAGFSLLLSGCLSDREMPGLRPKFATAEAAQHLVTPEFIRGCAEKVAKEYPSVNIAGSFVLSPKAAGKFNDLEELFPKDNIVALVAPTTNVGLFGQQNKSYSGCSYRLEDGRLVFHKVHGPASFAPKVIVVQLPR
jgi:hypothetical protein